MVSIAEELLLRQLIMDRLAERTVHNGGFLSRAELSDFRVGDTSRRLIDTSKGIWNPKDLSATLTIVSSPDGPYDDRDVEGGLFRYAYRAGSLAGDNSKLRRAADLSLPLILLRKIATGVYVPVFPVYVVDDDQAARQFTIALDESLRFLPRPSEWTDDQPLQDPPQCLRRSAARHLTRLPGRDRPRSADGGRRPHAEVRDTEHAR